VLNKLLCWVQILGGKRKYFKIKKSLHRIIPKTQCPHESDQWPGIMRSRLSRARILKHLLEAEKSTIHEELSFQRSQSTTGSNREEFRCVDRKDFVCESNKRLKVFQITLHK
jgi:hypothetical protein